jgi:gluconolactonase
MRFDLSDLEPIAEGLDHPEGVTVTPEGVLYAGGEAGQIYRVDIENGKFEEVANTGGFMLGLCADADGLLYCCDVGRREVVRVNPETGAVEVYSNGTPKRRMVNPNWPVFDSDGNLYVTDSGTWKGNDGCVMRIDAEGSTEIWTAESSNFPNGAALAGDGGSLLVLESCTPALVRFAIQDDGSPGPREEVARLAGTVPDGVALDTDGNAYVCCYRPDRILLVSPAGRVETLADDPEGTVLSAPTNGVWVGDDRKSLITGNLGRWHLTKLRPGGTGVPLRYPKVGGGR